MQHKKTTKQKKQQTKNKKNKTQYIYIFLLFFLEFCTFSKVPVIRSPAKEKTGKTQKKTKTNAYNVCPFLYLLFCFCFFVFIFKIVVPHIFVWGSCF